MKQKCENVLQKFLLQMRKMRMIFGRSVITQLVMVMKYSAILQMRVSLPVQRKTNIQIMENKNHKTLKGKISFVIYNIQTYVQM